MRSGPPRQEKAAISRKEPRGSRRKSRENHSKPADSRAWYYSRHPHFRGDGRRLVLDGPRLLFILNLTPDSFSDGGVYPTVAAAVRAAETAIRDGADGIDIGGESTRPGAAHVPPQEQIRRVVPVIRAVRRAIGSGPLISIDTTRAEVAAAALDAGADAINDVSAGTEDGAMFPLAAARGAGIILMHRLTSPDRDSYSTRYRPSAEPRYPRGVVATVRAFLAARARAAITAGIPRDAIVLDPGLGFGKTVAQNAQLIDRTAELASLGYPILSGISRKSFAAHLSGISPDSPPRDRVPGSVALAVTHLLHGAMIFRVHDIAPHRQALLAAWESARVTDTTHGTQRTHSTETR